MRVEVLTDYQMWSVATSSVSGVAAYVANDWSLAVFGVQLSIVLAGFAGSMAIMSFLPKFDTRAQMVAAVTVCTLASAYLTKLALKLFGLDVDYGLGVSFLIGFLFQMGGTWIVSSKDKIFEALLARLRGGKQ